MAWALTVSYKELLDEIMIAKYGKIIDIKDYNNMGELIRVNFQTKRIINDFTEKSYDPLDSVDFKEIEVKLLETIPKEWKLKNERFKTLTKDDLLKRDFDYPEITLFDRLNSINIVLHNEEVDIETLLIMSEEELRIFVDEAIEIHNKYK